LDQFVDLRHALAVLANRLPWQEVEASHVHRFSWQVRTGKQIEYLGFFGPTVPVAGAGVSIAGCTRLTALSQAVQETLGHSVAKVARMIAQTRYHRAKDKQPKLQESSI